MLVDLASKYNKPVVAIPRVEDALEAALSAAGTDAVVLATGSIFLAAAVRSAWHQRSEQFPVTMD
jgi:folylpolyglutamate synthase/dihydropteroate synthase